jgi:hypothetical protein
MIDKNQEQTKSIQERLEILSILWATEEIDRKLN